MTNAPHSNEAKAADGLQTPARRGLSVLGWINAALLTVLTVMLLAFVAGSTLLILKQREVASHDARLAEVRIGDDSAKPIALFGQPHQVNHRPKLFRAAPRTFGFAGDQAATQRQLVYFVRTPFLPFTYVFDIDQRGMVVAKFRLD